MHIRTSYTIMSQILPIPSASSSIYGFDFSQFKESKYRLYVGLLLCSKVCLTFNAFVVSIT